MQVRLLNIYVKFVYQGHGVKVTGSKNWIYELTKYTRFAF